MPVYTHGRVVETPLVERLSAVVVHVETTVLVATVAVAARVRRTELVAPQPRRHVAVAASREIAEGTAFETRFSAARQSSVGLLPVAPHLRHDVDGSSQARCAKHPSGGTFEHLDALNLADVHWEIKTVVTGLRIADVDAVEQNCDLLLCSSPDAYVCLRANGPSLADVHPCCILEQIVNTLYRRRLNVLAAQYSDHSRRLS